MSDNMKIYEAHLKAASLAEHLLIADSLKRYAGHQVGFHLDAARREFDELTRRMERIASSEKTEEAA